MKPSFLDHIVVIVSKLDRSEEFYSAFLGKPLHRDQYSVAYKIGDTKLFLGLPYGKLKRKSFDKEELGLNHLAFGVRTLAELKKLEGSLNKAKIKTAASRSTNTARSRSSGSTIRTRCGSNFI